MKNTTSNKCSACVSRNPMFSDMQMISKKQIELVFKIREYRFTHNLSQMQFAKIATVYGQPHKVKFTNYDISVYERFLHAPSLKKMYILLNMLGITFEDLEYSARECS